MNTQVHETTGACPYELVFGQKPREVLFPSGQKYDVIFEEDLECDGVVFEEKDHSKHEVETSPSRHECRHSNETSLNENKSKFNSDSDGGQDHNDNKETSPSRHECGHSNETSLNENQSKFNSDSNGGENHNDNKQNECYIIGTTKQDENQQSESDDENQDDNEQTECDRGSSGRDVDDNNSRVSTAVTVAMEVKMMRVILKSWRIFWRKE